jgi:hypothetical protein
MYENRIRSLNRDAATQAEYSTKVGGVLKSISEPSAATTVTGENAASTNLSAQIDGAFVDKIVQLSEKGLAIDFEKDLQLQRLEIENNTVSISDTRARLTERLTALRLTTLDGIEKQKFEQQFVTGFADAINQMNSIWRQLVDLSSEFSADRLNYDKTLYRLSSLPSDVRISRAELVDMRSLFLVVAAGLLGAAAGALFRFLREQMAKPSRLALT